MRHKGVSLPSATAPCVALPPASLQSCSRLRLLRRHPLKIPPASSRGFTLLELLLAFVVFALSFATVLEILSGSMRNTVRARHHTEAALTAQSVMDQVGLEIPLAAGINVDGQSGDYNWSVRIYDYADTGENPHSVQLSELTGIKLLQIDLDVSWGEAPGGQSSQFGTIRAVLADRE